MNNYEFTIEAEATTQANLMVAMVMNTEKKFIYSRVMRKNDKRAKRRLFDYESRNELRRLTNEKFKSLMAGTRKERLAVCEKISL